MESCFIQKSTFEFIAISFLFFGLSLSSVSDSDKGSLYFFILSLALPLNPLSLVSLLLITLSLFSLLGDTFSLASFLLNTLVLLLSVLSNAFSLGIFISFL